MIINNSDNFNPNALNVPDLYVVVKRPPGYINGAISQSAGKIGTASYGPVDVPVLTSAPVDVQAYFGGITAASYADPYDLCSAAIASFAQAEQEFGIIQWLMRITDGTDVKAFTQLKDTTSVTPKNGIKLTCKESGSGGNLFASRVVTGSKTGCFHVDIIPFSGLQTERFENIQGGSAGVFWANLLTAINTGQGSLRGPSQLVDASNVDATAINPALSSYTFASGTDGRGVATADFVGNPALDPPTGIWAFGQLDPTPAVFSCVGMTDDDAFPDIANMGMTNGILCLADFPMGTDVATAVAAKKTLGIDNWNFAYCKDWIEWYDPVAGKPKRLAPSSIISGRIAALSPENSPLNKQVAQVIGTERVSPNIPGSRPYQPGDIGQMQENGILFVTNPCPGGKYFGIRHGSNSCSNGPQHGIEYTTMTNWLTHSLNGYMGKYVGFVQSTDVDDPVRLAITAVLTKFLEDIKIARQIDKYKVVCDNTNNPDSMIEKRICTADAYVRYMSIIAYFIINLQGGNTVRVESRLITEQQAQAIGV